MSSPQEPDPLRLPPAGLGGAAHSGVYGRSAPSLSAGNVATGPTGRTTPLTRLEPKARGGLLVAALIVGIVALVFSIAGVVIAALALGRSGNVTASTSNANNEQIPGAAGNPQPPLSAPPGLSSQQPLSPEATASPGDVDPTAEFVVAYDDQHLRVQSVACRYANATGIDLDEPRVVGDDRNAEMGYAGCDPGSIHVGLGFAQVSGPGASPADCLEKIRTAPGRSPVAPARGITLCIVTSQNNATAQGITQKLVLVTVDSITRDKDAGVLNVTLKAWNVPQ